MIVEMVVLNAVVVGLLRAALHLSRRMANKRQPINRFQRRKENLNPELQQRVSAHQRMYELVRFSSFCRRGAAGIHFQAITRNSLP